MKKNPKNHRNPGNFLSYLQPVFQFVYQVFFTPGITYKYMFLIFPGRLWTCNIKKIYNIFLKDTYTHGFDFVNLISMLAFVYTDDYLHFILTAINSISQSYLSLNVIIKQVHLSMP